MRAPPLPWWVCNQEPSNPGDEGLPRLTLEERRGGQGRIRREGTSEAAPEAETGGWRRLPKRIGGRLLSVNPIEPGTCHQGDAAGRRLGALERAWGGGTSPPSNASLGGGIWDPKVCVPKMARSDFPNGKFRFFPRWSLWSGGKGGPSGGLGARGGRLPTVPMRPPPPAICQNSGGGGGAPSGQKFLLSF